jgi:hypothetical protein
MRGSRRSRWRAPVPVLCVPGVLRTENDDACETVRKAIVDRVSLIAHYDNYVRFFSPHALGSTRGGQKAVLAYQYDGGKPGKLRLSGEWACFEIAGLGAIRRTGDIWHRGDGLTSSRCLETVEVSADVK